MNHTIQLIDLDKKYTTRPPVNGGAKSVSVAFGFISKKCLCSWDLGALGALGSLIKKLCAPGAELGVFGSNWSMGSAESET